MSRKIIFIAIGVLALTTAALIVSKSSGKKNAVAATSDLPKNRNFGKSPNRLIHEKSPYLLRHAYDPVDWHPWGEEAFQTARKTNKPIFLSIGYASCFACYSMQRDVFEDRKIADEMNDYAVNILVDREERPDIDRLYMTAIQTISGTGGWPMSLFLTPERKPFFGATYLSPAAFTKTLSRVHEVWQKDPEKLSSSGDLIANYLQDLATGENKKTTIDSNTLRKAFEAFGQLYDPQFGGFGSAPKFPHPIILNFLLRYYRRTNEKQALEMTLTTLKEMSAGAIFDHIGYGFHRYSADDQWRTPHFEKMTYDQALLTIAYLEAYQVTHDPKYSSVAKNVLAYAQREMMSAEGAFYGAEDAASSRDSNANEKVPGIFYTWTNAEVDQILGPADATIFRYLSGIRPEGNSLRDPMNILANRNVIFSAHTEQETALKFNKTLGEVHSIAENCRQKLLAVRNQRPRPPIDDKIILSWNALMISAFAKAYEVLGDRAYLHTAQRCNQFLNEKLYSSTTHQLLRRYRNGEARFEGTLQDYAFYVQSLLDLYEASFETQYLQQAITLSDEMIKLFEDQVNGGFFDTAADDQSLPVRSREFYDDSEPSGNSIAILDLMRLSQMIDSDRYRKIADHAMQFFSDRATDQPEAMPQFLTALEFTLHKPKEIIIAGTADDQRTKELLNQIHSRFLPDKVILLADGADGQKTLAGFLPMISAIHQLQDRSTAYVCENYVCQLPTSDPIQLGQLLDSKILQ